MSVVHERLKLFLVFVLGVVGSPLIISFCTKAIGFYSEKALVAETTSFTLLVFFRRQKPIGHLIFSSLEPGWKSGQDPAAGLSHNVFEKPKEPKEEETDGLPFLAESTCRLHKIWIMSGPIIACALLMLCLVQAMKTLLMILDKLYSMLPTPSWTTIGSVGGLVFHRIKAKAQRNVWKLAHFALGVFALTEAIVACLVLGGESSIPLYVVFTGLFLCFLNKFWDSLHGVVKLLNVPPYLNVPIYRNQVIAGFQSKAVKRIVRKTRAVMSTIKVITQYWLKHLTFFVLGMLGYDCKWVLVIPLLWSIWEITSFTPFQLIKTISIGIPWALWASLCCILHLSVIELVNRVRQGLFVVRILKFLTKRLFNDWAHHMRGTKAEGEKYNGPSIGELVSVAHDLLFSSSWSKVSKNRRQC